MLGKVDKMLNFFVLAAGKIGLSWPVEELAGIKYHFIAHHASYALDMRCLNTTLLSVTLSRKISNCQMEGVQIVPKKD